MSKHLVIFARAPRMGRVKRRLAADIGPVAALRFYRGQLAGLLRSVGRDARWRTWIAVTPDGEASGAAARTADTEVLPQGPGDLGRRMARVMRALPPGPAVIVGSDIPALDSRHVAAAFAALGRAEAVVGPSDDGGYWLFGLRRLKPVPYGLFEGVRWSGPHALTDTLAGLPPRWRVAELEVLSDIDDGEDFAAFRNSGGALT